MKITIKSKAAMDFISIMDQFHTNGTSPEPAAATIRADDFDGCSVEASSLSGFTTLPFECEEITESGEATLPIKQLKNALAAMPNGARVTIECVAGKATVSSRGAKTRIQSVSQVVKRRPIEGDASACTLLLSDLSKGIADCSPFASKEDQLTSCVTLSQCSINEGNLSIQATNRRMGVIRSVGAKIANPDGAMAAIDATLCPQLAGLLKCLSEGACDVRWSDATIEVSCAGAIIQLAQPSVKILTMHSLVERFTDANVNVVASELRDSVRSVSLVATEHSTKVKRVRVDMQQGKLRVSTMDNMDGTESESEIETEGVDFDCILNANYLHQIIGFFGSSGMAVKLDKVGRGGTALRMCAEPESHAIICTMAAEEPKKA